MALQLDVPATYRIRIEGFLDSSWSDRLCGLTIHPSTQADGQAVTTLHGLVPDQAALAGVLNTLYTLHLPILSVECLSVQNRKKIKEKER
ncbi:MAG TPA: hypothetical protein ENJ31_09035 [Anaerolineae bacterium]|nr:hypothetical protein [Anaerolineae bacterium]